MEVLERNNQPLPPWIADAPQVPDHQAPVWAAFQTLTDSRQMGMAAGPIPLTEIEAYLRLFDITDPDDVDEYLTLIRRMDREYLKVSSEQQSKK
jgi:hypothetical protein